MHEIVYNYNLQVLFFYSTVIKSVIHSCRFLVYTKFIVSGSVSIEGGHQKLFDLKLSLALDLAILRGYSSYRVRFSVVARHDTGHIQAGASLH